MGRSARLLTVAAAAAGLAVIALVGWSLLSADAGRGGPPLSGWMRKFTIAPAPAKAPGTRFVGRDGTTYTLDDFRGKVVLVNFWATWCGPCIRELPSLVRLQNSGLDGGFTVLALSQDRDGWAKIAPFLATHRLEGLPFYHDPRAAFAAGADIRALPTSVLYARDGGEIGRLLGHAEWDSEEAVALIRHYLARQRGFGQAGQATAQSSR